MRGQISTPSCLRMESVSCSNCFILASSLSLFPQSCNSDLFVFLLLLLFCFSRTTVEDNRSLVTALTSEAAFSLAVYTGSHLHIERLSDDWSSVQSQSSCHRTPSLPKMITVSPNTFAIILGGALFRAFSMDPKVRLYSKFGQISLTDPPGIKERRHTGTGLKG